MYAPTAPLLRGFFSRKKDMQSMVESHFWSLTRYRILPHFLGLDLAGNVILFPSYRKQGFGGWTAVTLGAPGTASGAFLSSDMSAVNVLEDGHPIHYKASQKLQAFVQEERRRWQAKTDAAKKKQADAIAAEAKGRLAEAALKEEEAAAAGNAAAKGAAAVGHPPTFGAELKPEHIADYDSEQQFRDMLAIKCSHPRFYRSQLRISRFVTFAYKFFYFYLWAVLVSFIIQGYLMFRAWVNQPAREGLKNIEEHVLHIPRLLFSACISGVVWLVRSAKPVLDPIVNFLSEKFPQVNWGAASADRLAARAQHLADDAHPKAEERRQKEMKQQQLTEAARRTWWTRVLMILLALFSVLCVL